MAGLKGRLAAVPAQAPGEIVRLPIAAEICRRKVEALEIALQDEAIRPEAIEILRSMMERVVVTPTKDATLRVELHGDIARLITADEPNRAPARKTKHAASGEAARTVLSVVAGERNHLYRTRFAAFSRRQRGFEPALGMSIKSAS
ncbi:MAG: hypothetical protein ACM3O6_17005 [Acidobacteriota bacterium]